MKITDDMLRSLIKEQIEKSKNASLNEQYDNLLHKITDNNLHEASLGARFQGLKAGISAFFKEMSRLAKERESQAVQAAMQEIPTAEEEMQEVLDDAKIDAAKSLEEVIARGMNAAKAKQIPNPEQFLLTLLSSVITATVEKAGKMEISAKISRTHGELWSELEKDVEAGKKLPE